MSAVSPSTASGDLFAGIAAESPASAHAPAWRSLGLPSSPEIFTGVDIGTTKVCCVIGEIRPDGTVTILGVASTPSQGLRRGVVINLEETIDSVRTAIRKAEEIAQHRAKDVFVGIAGGHIRCHQVSASIDVSNPERGISKADMRRATNMAVSGHATVEREVIETIPQRYLTDDGWVMDPEGFSSRKLGVELLLVSAAVTSAQNIVRSVSEAGYRASSIYLEPLASSLAILSRLEKELGVVVIDIGGGTSDVAIWADDAVRYIDVVPFGGDAVTEDLAKVLKISRYDAENLKKKHGHAVASELDPGETIDVPVVLTGGTRQVPRVLVAEIIESRMEEILSLAHQRISGLAPYKQVRGGVVLTGGASLLPGLTKVAGRVFGQPCKIGVPSGLGGLSSVVSSPIYSTGVGLVLHGLESPKGRFLLDEDLFHRLIRRFKEVVASFR
ncbi:MAG: cell division protein FtsA [Candidatus Sumerlaeia bacterium]|nr:cell division protein FtsA [Candidatus Sumerlaeia bacterium]